MVMPKLVQQRRHLTGYYFWRRFTIKSIHKSVSRKVGIIREASARRLAEASRSFFIADAGDRHPAFQSDVSPGLARACRFVDSIDLDDIAAQFGLSHPDVYDVGIRRRHGDRAWLGLCFLSKAVRSALA
jgi:hypothetical protein